MPEAILDIGEWRFGDVFAPLARNERKFHRVLQPAVGMLAGDRGSEDLQSDDGEGLSHGAS